MLVNASWLKLDIISWKNLISEVEHHRWYCSQVDDTWGLVCEKLQPWSEATCLPPDPLSDRCNLSYVMDSPPQAPMSSSAPHLLLRHPTQCASWQCASWVCVCVSQPCPTSQSNSRCSCPSIHSSISSLLCRSLRLYLTVSLPSLRCVGSCVLSVAWNITLDWVLGSDAMAATASGEPWKRTELTHTHTHTDRQTHRLWHVRSAHRLPCSLSLSLPFLWAAVPTRISCYLVECSCSSSLWSWLRFSACPRPLSLSLSLSLSHSLSVLLSFPSSSCNTHWLHYQEDGNEICLCACACESVNAFVCVYMHFIGCVFAFCSLPLCYSRWESLGQLQP